MLTDKRILITGVTGKAVLPIAAALARDNQVWGQARFADPASRAAVEALGIRPCSADLGVGDLSDLPADIEYLLHFAWMRGERDELEQALRVNVEGAGLLLHRYRAAKAALVVSSTAIYAANTDPWHAYAETDTIGPSVTASAQTSPICKAGLEAMARFASRAYGLPVTIARLNTVLGPHKAFYGKQAQAVIDGVEIVLPGDPSPHTPIHTDDMIAHIEPLLGAARPGAFTVNWCGDDIANSPDTIARIAERSGRIARVRVATAPGLAGGNISDPSRRRAITGSCAVSFQAGFERMLDEMLDGAEPALPQRSWDYGSATQHHMFKGA